MTVQRFGVRPDGYRLPDATHVGRVRLQVADLRRSLSYYEEVLGLQVLDREGSRAVLGPQGAGTALLELHELAGAVPSRGRLGLYHFAILLPERPALGRLLAHLTERGVRAGAADHLVSEALYLHDPDGLGIEVYTDRPRETWQGHGAELVMDTVSLNGSDLTRAAGGKAWSGMPSGTTMGHIHLHVGDLDRAAQFYHLALGLDKMVWTYPGALFLSAGGYHHHLGLNTWAGPSAQPPHPDEARLLEWELRLPDAPSLAAAAQSLEHAGFTVSRTDQGWRADDPWHTTVHAMPAIPR
jgi:catechol 2,3-dioxygenase